MVDNSSGNSEVTKAQEDKMTEEASSHELKTSITETKEYSETQSVTTPMSTPTNEKSKTQIDGLSREDLIKHIKKQTLLLQKMKARLDDLTEECSKLKEEANSRPEKHLVQELQIFKSERDHLQKELKSTKQIVLTQEQKYEDQIDSLLKEKAALEQDVLQLKTSKQKELNDLHGMNESLSHKVEELEFLVNTVTEARDDLGDKMKVLNENHENILQEKHRLQDHIVTLQQQFDIKFNEEKNKYFSEVSKLEAQTQMLKIDFDKNQEDAKREEMKKVEQIKLLQAEIKSISEELVMNKKESILKDEEIKSLKLLTSAKGNEQGCFQQEEQSTVTTSAVNIEAHAHQDTSTGDLYQIQSESCVHESVTKLTTENEKLAKLIDEKNSVHKDEVKKLKAYAVKLKKELADLQEKEKLANQQIIELNRSLSDEQKSVLELKSLFDQSVEKYTNDLEKEQQEKQCLKSSATKLEDDKKKVELSLHALEETYRSLKGEHDSIKAALLSTQNDLSNCKRSYADSVAEVHSLHATLKMERENFDILKQKMVVFEKESKSASLMNLELADYQRSLETLRGQLKEKETLHLELQENFSSIESKNQQLINELESCKENLLEKEEMSTKMKVLLRRNTKELMDMKTQMSEDALKHEEVKSALEITMQSLEMAKVEIANLTATFQTDLEQAKASQSHYQQLVQSLESKISFLQSELDSAKNACQIKQNEFDSYKVRVHSVLKQKESTSLSVSDIEATYKHQHEIELAKYKTELKETRERLGNLLSEHEELQTEHQQLLNVYDCYVHDSKRELQQLQNRLLESEDNYITKTQNYENVVTQLRLEIAENTAAFKSQFSATQKEYQSQLSHLQNQLQQALDKLGQQKLELESNATMQIKGLSNSKTGDSLKMSDAKVFPTEERSSGEGMDCLELEVSRLATSATITNTSLSQSKDEYTSLESLLTMTSTNIPSLNEHDVETTQSEEFTLIQQKNVVLAKKMTHLTELLHESEANCMRLTDQTKLLKEEIRRLERNQERQKEASGNMEYLKNVVLKFLHSPSDERIKLIPIITQLLHLSQQERHYLQETLKGKNISLPDPTGDSPNISASSKSLVNYLHRWTGYQ